MRDRWNHLSLRDQRVICLSMGFLVIVLFYIVIWQPLSARNTLLRSQIQHNKQLLVWMQAANQRIKSLQIQSPSLSSHSDASALSIVQDALQDSVLAGKFSQLKQAEMDSVQLNFQSVNFDELISWLTKIGQQGLIVSQISITPSDSAGVVTAGMTLKRI